MNLPTTVGIFSYWRCSMTTAPRHHLDLSSYRALPRDAQGELDMSQSEFVGLIQHLLSCDKCWSRRPAWDVRIRADSELEDFYDEVNLSQKVEYLECLAYQRRGAISL